MLNKGINKIRYVYIKNGDAVKQLKRIMPLKNNVITSGPDAFIYDFLNSSEYDCVLLISCSNRNAIFTYENIKASVYNHGSTILGKLISRVWIFIKVFYRLISFRPDRIICGCTGSLLWSSYLVSLIYSVPLVHSRHNRVISDREAWFKQIATIMDNWCVKKCTAVICHGPFIKQQLVEAGTAATKIYAFDVGFRDLLTGTLSADNIYKSQLDKFNKIILFIGRVETDKGVFDLLLACKRRLECDPQMCLVFVGQGSKLGKLKQEVKEYNLSDKAIIFGEMQHKELAGLIRNCMVVVTPTKSSFREGRCMVAMEALVLGRPVIAPDFGPFPFLIKDKENGLLYEPDSIDDLHKKINMMLDNPSLYNKLCDGAKISGKNLIMPKITFSQAVKKAFNYVEDNK